MRNFFHRFVACLVFLISAAGVAAAEEPATIYKQSCAACHDTGENRAPAIDALRQLSPERVLNALENGPMISMANRRSPAERRALAEFVTGKSFAQPLDTTPSAKAMCAGAVPDFTNPLSGPNWNGWGELTSNARYQPAPGFTAADVPKLKLK